MFLGLDSDSLMGLNGGVPIQEKSLTPPPWSVIISVLLLTKKIRINLSLPRQMGFRLSVHFLLKVFYVLLSFWFAISFKIQRSSACRHILSDQLLC